MRFLIRYVLKASDHVVVLTASWRKKIDELTGGKARISVVGNPIDTLKYHPFQRDHKPGRRPHLLFLGALIKNKGVYDIIDCIRLLKGLGVTVQVTLAGDRELDQVRLRSQELGVQDLIDLPGWVSEATKLQLLKNCDLLLLPSYKEGLPLCVLEAMAVGLPVICSNAGGLGDLVNNGENGFIMVPGDIETMANHIAMLVQDSVLRQQIGQKNAKKVRDFYSILAIAQQVGNLYGEALSRPKRGYRGAWNRFRHLRQGSA